MADGDEFVPHAPSGVAAVAAITAQTRGNFEFNAAFCRRAEVGADDNRIDDAALGNHEACPKKGARAYRMEPTLDCKSTHSPHLWPAHARLVTRKRMPCSRAVRGIERLRQVLACAVWCLASMSEAAQAQDSTGAIRAFEAPTGCPTREMFEGDIAANLGQTPPANVADVMVRARDEGFSATITFRAGDARTVEGESCAGLMRALALIVAVQIDPEAMFRAPRALEIPALTPLPVPEEEAISELEGACEPGREVRWEPDCPLAEPFGPRGRVTVEPAGRFLIGSALTLEFGAMPGVSPGAWLGGTARIGILEIGAEARYQPEAFSPLPQRPVIGAIVSLIAGRVRVGAAITLGELGPASFEFVPHITLELGALSARGAGLLSPIGASSLWIALAPGAEIRAFFFEHFGLFVRAELEIALRRSPFVIAGYSSPAFLASPVGLTSIVGILLRTN